MHASLGHRIVVFSSGLVTALAMLASTAWAGPPPGPCAADRAKLCADVKPGGGGRLQCLVSHENELSPECKAHVKEMKARHDEITESCTDDAEKLCKGIEAGRGRVMRCLADHESKLTADCRAEVEKAKATRAELKEKVEATKGAMEDACAADVTKNCAGIQKGKGRILQCLKSHEATLTPACKAALP
ncbi:MAG: cysteine rich repeat-containing protein [bacterium]